ncbi:MAG TPA: lysophospholipid acyltransferase family protein [Terrimicrobiaceae bacterium]
MPSARAESPPPLAEHLPAQSLSLPACWGYLKQIFCLAFFFGVGLVVSPLCALLARFFGDRIPPSAGQRLIRNLFGVWLRFACRIGVFDIQFPEAERLRNMRGTVLAPNHPSLVDAVILLSIVPNTVCIMRAKLIESPFLGGAARLAGFVPNDKGPALIRQGMQKLQAGENLLIFPEGTRTATQAINPFKNGFALIAKKTGASIQTVFIEREGRYLSKGVSLFAFARPPFRFRLHLGRLVHAAPEESPQQLSARLELYFREHLENTGEDIRLRKPS